jgi:site-specific recombinase XerD
MFSMWYSGNARDRYRATPYKGRIDRIGSRLVEDRYLDDAIRHHLHEWLRFIDYLDRCNAVRPVSRTDECVRRYVAERTRGTSASHGRFVRASVRIFLEADEAGHCRRRVGTARRVPSWFADTLSAYLAFVERHRGLAPRTVRQYARKLSAFAEYLEQVEVTQLGAITPRHVRDFYENASGGRPRRSYGSSLRAFFRWASTQRAVPVALTDAVPRPRRYRLAILPDVLSDADVERIVAAVDRSTPVGRRDYAVLLLAARYGLRPCDIRQLTLDQIDWRRACIDIRQAKTGRPLVLPLLSDVADALTAYLRCGRPPSASRVIFVRHRAPFEPFVAENNLSTIMGAALKRVGLANRPGRRGLYLFRHTLATRLLAAGHPLKTIADVLGHASTDTTYGYTRVELGALHSVAIAEAEVCS